MQLLLDQYSRNKDQGLDYLTAGDRGEARHHLLLAAKYLLKAAGRSEGSLGRIRREKALKLKEMALALSRNSTKASKEPAVDQERESRQPESAWLLSEKPSVGFDQIAGLDDVKEAINLRVIYPFRHPEIADRFKKKAGGGMLLYGPPGTGKTMVAKAVATELDAQFLDVKSSNIMSQWVGVAEQNLARLFDVARRHPASVIFLDETEALVGKRGGNSTVMNRVIPEFLAQVDGVQSQDGCILLMGATNRPWDIDEAALRTGRFSEQFYVGLPDTAAREQIFRLRLDGLPMEADVDYADLAGKTEGLTGADLAGVCNLAIDLPFNRQVKSRTSEVLTRRDLDETIARFRPSVSAAMLERFRKFSERR